MMFSVEKAAPDGAAFLVVVLPMPLFFRKIPCLIATWDNT